MGVSVFTFLLADLAPGEFLDAERLERGISPEEMERRRHRQGLDRSLPERYLAWVGGLLRGDLGESLSYGEPAAPLLVRRGANTLLLALAGTCLAWGLALPAGVWAARRPGGWRGRAVEGVAVVLLALPELVIALLLLGVAVRVEALPLGGMGSLDAPGGVADRLGSLASHLLLPMVAVSLGVLPVLLKHVKASVEAALAAPWVGAARARGLDDGTLLWRHARKAAANPLTTLLGLSLGALLSVSLVVEVIMGWPGLGPLLLQAILARDFPLVLGAVLISALLLLAGNLVADLLLWLLDPRVRSEAA